MKFRVEVKKALSSKILLIISCLKILNFNICPYVFCPGCIILRQHFHCYNFINFIYFFLFSFLSHPPVLNRPNNILYRMEFMILQRTSRCVCAHKTNRCSSVKHNHYLFYIKLIICFYIVLSSGIITPIGGRPVHRCTVRPPIGVMIAVAA